MFRKLFLIVSLTLSLTTGFSQSPANNLIHLTIEDGLAHAMVYTAYMDSRKYMWFGTRNGLQRYDGRKFKTYLPVQEDSTSISGRFIKDIIEDTKRKLWISTEDGGLNRFDPETETFRSYQHDTTDQNSIRDDLLTVLHIDV